MKAVGFVVALLVPIELCAISLTRGPYVQMGHLPNQITVVWRTDASADSWVDYGLSASYGATASGASGWQHEVTLTGLLPGTNYHYRVRSGGANLATGQFKTGKTAGTPFRIATLSDAHEAGASGVGGRMALFAPDLILAAGDITDDGNFSELDNNLFTKFTDVLRNAPVYWVAGNHDVKDNFAVCRDAFVLPADELNYWFEYADAQIVALNSESLPGTQWLSEALAASAKRWKIVFFHRPAYSPAAGHGEFAPIRDDYVPIMEHYGVSLTVAGHNHYYWRSVPLNGITHFQQGRSGNRWRDINSLPCYSAAGINGSLMRSFGIVDIHGDFMRVAGYDEAGNLLDETVIDRECPFVMDGIRDRSAVRVASRTGGLTLWAGIRGRYLYVATTEAGAGNDHFIFLARARTGATSTNVWSKSGFVMAFDAFVAAENDNEYNAWYNAAGGIMGNLRVGRSARPLCAGVFEGVIDLEALYGEVPEKIYLAAAPYATVNAGSLVASGQCPAGNGDGNVDPPEFLEVNTADITFPFLLEGLVESPGYLIADNNGMRLWAAVSGEILYVASWSPGIFPSDTTKNDHFIVVADQLTALQPAFAAWNKAGMIAVSTNTPFLGGESINDYAGWQQTTATVYSAKWSRRSGQMEGTINLREAFGAVPETLYLAAAPYLTVDGGALYAPSQVPTGNGDGNIDANEFLVVPFAAIRDDNLDGILDVLDPSIGFAAKAVASEAGFTLTWPCIPGNSYRVYVCDEPGREYSPLTGEVTAAQGQFSMSYTDAGAPHASRCFYKIRLTGP